MGLMEPTREDSETVQRLKMRLWNVSTMLRNEPLSSLNFERCVNELTSIWKAWGQEGGASCERSINQSGRIPDDVLNDEQIVDKLPVLFRTLRGQRVDDEDLEDLVKRIKRA